MAANPLKGEIDLPVGAKTYTLCFTSNAIVQVEAIYGGDVSIGEIAARQDVGHIRTLLWGGLVTHHEDVDLITAGVILDDYDGPMTEVLEKIVRALRFRLSRTALDVPLEPPKPDAE